MIRRASPTSCTQRAQVRLAQAARPAASPVPRRCDVIRPYQPTSLLTVRRQYANASAVHELEKYSTSVADLVKQRKYAEADAMVKENEENGIRPAGMYVEAMNAALNNNDLSKGRVYFDQLLKIASPAVSNINRLMIAYMTAKQPSECEALLGLMKQRGIVPSPETYNFVVGAFCRVGDVDKARHFLLQQSKQSMCDAQSYTSVMSALLERNRLVEAKEIFQRMEMDAVTPDATAVSTLISGIARLGDVAEAEALYANAKKQYGVEPNMYSATAMIAAYAEQGRTAKMEEYLRKLREAGMKPDLQTYTALISGYAKGNRPALAKEVIATIKQEGLKLDMVAYSAMIGGIARCGLLDEARVLLEEMKSRGFSPNFITYRSLISAYAAHRMVHEAKELIVKMEQDGIYADYKMFLPILLAQQARNNFPGIHRTLEEMKERGIQADKRVRILQNQE